MILRFVSFNKKSDRSRKLEHLQIAACGGMKVLYGRGAITEYWG
jgi:hypothetical protein